MNSSTNKKSKIWLSPPHMCGKEQQFIDVAFKENYIAPVGSNISGFENDLEKYLKQNRFVTALNSGTAAIHLALILLKIGKNDEVICQLPKELMLNELQQFQNLIQLRNNLVLNSVLNRLQNQKYLNHKER